MLNAEDLDNLLCGLRNNNLLNYTHILTGGMRKERKGGGWRENGREGAVYVQHWPSTGMHLVDRTL